MLLRCISVGALMLALALPGAASAQAPGPLTLAQALQRALSANARLFAADREIGMAEGRRTQAGATRPDDRHVCAMRLHFPRILPCREPARLTPIKSGSDPESQPKRPVM